MTARNVPRPARNGMSGGNATDRAVSSPKLPAALRGLVAKGRGGPGNSGGSASPRGIFSRLADLYRRMEQAYAKSAGAAGLSCEGCATNCCVSYFQHHTHVEWIYLWKGLSALPSARRGMFVERAAEYVEHANSARSAGVLPSRMCPLNESGLCALYEHRLMICRMHGTRNVLVLPDGSRRMFPGCERFASLSRDTQGEVPALDRTPFYRELAALEMELYQRVGGPPRKVDLTLAEMIVLGPPDFSITS